MNLEDERRERTARRLAASLAEPEQHLDFDGDLSPYVDGTLDAAGREIVESHVEECAMCRQELEDLQELAHPRLRERALVWPLAAAAAVAVVAFLLMRHSEAPSVAVPPRPSVSVPAQRPAPVPASRPAYASAEWAQLVAGVLESGRLPVSPAVAELRSSPDDALRGGSGVRDAALSPAGVVIETTRPRFSWPATGGASYVVSVFANDEEVVTTPPLTAARWQPGDGLGRGVTYAWQVEVTRDGTSTVLPAPPAPPARFRILGRREHEELEAARRAHPGDAVLLAALYSRHGLLAEAEAELEKLRGTPDPRVQRPLSSAR